MKPKVKVIDGKNIFLNGMKKAGIEIPKNDAEFKALLGDIKKDFAKMEKSKK
jgi:hypothetical protein